MSPDTQRPGGSLVQRIRRSLTTRSAEQANARKCLAELADAIGDGLAASREHPHLLASLDQHQAALRDGLMLDLRPPSLPALAAYAQGIRYEAHRHGWQAPPGAVDWATCDDWVLIRLLAVHRLAETTSH